MADWLKITVRTAAVVLLVAAAVTAVVLLYQLDIPSLNIFNQTVQGATYFGTSLVKHYAPVLLWALAASAALITIDVTIVLIKMTMQGVQWVLKMWQ